MISNDNSDELDSILDDNAFKLARKVGDQATVDLLIKIRKLKKDMSIKLARKVGDQATVDLLIKIRKLKKDMSIGLKYNLRRLTKWEWKIIWSIKLIVSKAVKTKSSG